MSPRRIQRRRTKGWRLRDESPNAVIVDRSTVYGNPWTLADADHLWHLSETERRQWVVDRYERELRERGGTGEDEFVTIAEIRERLRGKDLACWCPLGQACHVDVLLRVANEDQP